MKRDEDLVRLRSEMKQIGDVCPRTGKTRGIYKIVEMAAARCGLYPSYEASTAEQSPKPVLQLVADLQELATYRSQGGLDAGYRIVAAELQQILNEWYGESGSVGESPRSMPDSDTAVHVPEQSPEPLPEERIISPCVICGRETPCVQYPYCKPSVGESQEPRKLIVDSRVSHLPMDCGSRYCAQHRDIWRHYEDVISRS